MDRILIIYFKIISLLVLILKKVPIKIQCIVTDIYAPHTSYAL